MNIIDAVKKAGRGNGGYLPLNDAWTFKVDHRGQVHFYMCDTERADIPSEILIRDDWEAVEEQVGVGDVVSCRCAVDDAPECVVIGKKGGHTAIQSIVNPHCTCSGKSLELKLIHKGPKRLVIDNVVWTHAGEFTDTIAPDSYNSTYVNKQIRDFIELDKPIYRIAVELMGPMERALEDGYAYDKSVMEDDV